MISIIISSYKPDYFSAVEKNIAETCGIPHEIIKIDNPGLIGICEAYNKGAMMAKYDVLLFIHEDIKFITTDWGSKLIVHHELERAGVIGVAGGKYIPSAPSGWYTDNENALINIVQGKKGESKKTIQTFSGVQKAFALDGVFLSIKKQIFTEYKFDEHLERYHGYDTEITLRIAKKYLNYVVSDILIEHYSAGNPDLEWNKANIYIRKKLGSNFHNAFNDDLELTLFVNYLHQYFRQNRINLNSILRTLQFFPTKASFRTKRIILKKYYNFIKFRNSYNCE